MKNLIDPFEALALLAILLAFAVLLITAFYSENIYDETVWHRDGTVDFTPEKETK